RSCPGGAAARRVGIVPWTPAARRARCARPATPRGPPAATTSAPLEQGEAAALHEVGLVASPLHLGSAYLVDRIRHEALDMEAVEHHLGSGHVLLECLH